MEPTQEELLLSRIVDRCESVTDWDTLTTMANTEAVVWQRLASWLRDDCLLRTATAPSLAFADRASLPVVVRPRALPAWAGWLCASALLLVLLLRDAGGAIPGPLPNGARPGAAMPIGELPRLLVHAEPAGDGRSMRVVSMRRILEEDVVQQAFQLDDDELGRPRPTPMELAAFAVGKEF